ncbi:hypothetical protein FACS1894159_12090 [Bacteroidia bacterium]|nr:hypothetical protein FACS1894159_12090 [Bacteroidia bacterium]
MPGMFRRYAAIRKARSPAAVARRRKTERVESEAVGTKVPSEPLFEGVRRVSD